MLYIEGQSMMITRLGDNNILLAGGCGLPRTCPVILRVIVLVNRILDWQSIGSNHSKINLLSYTSPFFTFNILYFIRPSFHFLDSILLTFAKIFFVYTSISYESDVQKVCCNNWECSYEKLTPYHTDIIISKEIVYYILKPTCILKF